MQSISVSLARGLTLGRKASGARARQTRVWAATAPSGDRRAAATPADPPPPPQGGPVPLPPNPPVSLAADQGTHGRQVEAKEWGSGSGGGASFHGRWLLSTSPATPSPRAHHSLVAALDPAVTKAGRGRRKRGEERQEMGRAGPAVAAAASSASPSRGLSHGRLPWVGELGAGVRTPGFSRATERERGVVPGDRNGGPGVAAGKGESASLAPRGGLWSEAPPPRAPPRAPFPLPIVLRQSGRRPPPGPQVSVSVPPPRLPLSLLLSFPPPLPPVSGSPSVPLSSSSSLLLPPDARLLRTPSPGSPAGL